MTAATKATENFIKSMRAYEEKIEKDKKKIADLEARKQKLDAQKEKLEHEKQKLLGKGRTIASMAYFNFKQKKREPAC